MADGNVGLGAPRGAGVPPVERRAALRDWAAQMEAAPTTLLIGAAALLRVVVAARYIARAARS